MDDLREMVKQYTIKHDAKLKKICVPLKECLDISIFVHFNVEPDGRFVNLANSAEGLDFYFTEKLHAADPFFSHPYLFRSGCVLVPLSYNPDNLKTISKHCQVQHMLLILQREGDRLEGSYFNVTASDKCTVSALFNNLELLYKFIRHFKREARPLIEQMKRDGFNVKQDRGKAFFEGSSSIPLSNQDPNIQRFLKLMLPLSAREQQCLELFKQGKTAQMTAAILGLSQRTIESYFDNIKNKLGCQSKADLLEW